MSSVIASTPLLNVARTPSPSIGTWVKNLLFGRVFANWKDSIIVAGVVFWVAKAVLSFFTGAWLMATAEFFTGGFLAMMRKDYRQFTDLHAATGAYRNENHDYRLSNLEHRRLNDQQRRQIEAFRQEVVLLAKERKRIAAENDRFAESNTVYKTQIGVMKRTLRSAISEIGSVSAEGKRIMQAALASFEEKERALTAIARDIDQRNKESVRQWQELAGQVSRLKFDGVRALNDAKAALGEVLAEIREYEATKKALSTEIGRLQQVRAQLEGVALKVDLAADRNLAAAGKRFVSNIMSGKSDESHAAILMGIALVGLIYAKATGTPIAGLS